LHIVFALDMLMFMSNSWLDENFNTIEPTQRFRRNNVQSYPQRYQRNLHIVEKVCFPSTTIERLVHV